MVERQEDQPDLSSTFPFVEKGIGRVLTDEEKREVVAGARAAEKALIKGRAKPIREVVARERRPQGSPAPKQ